jgi:hypothetical protein
MQSRLDTNLPVINLTTPDGIDIQLIKASSGIDTDKAILAFYGNADAAPSHILAFNRPDILNLGFNVYVLEYRGYNGNKGTPSERGFNIDARTALQYLESQGYKTIVYHGHSIGSAVAVGLAQNRIPEAMILVSPFTSLAEAARTTVPFLPVPVIRMLLKDQYANDQILPQLEIPNLLIIHALDDEILSPQMGRTIYELANSPNKTLVESEFGGHNNVLAATRHYLINFLRSLVEEENEESNN